MRRLLGPCFLVAALGCSLGQSVVGSPDAGDASADRPAMDVARDSAIDVPPIDIPSVEDGGVDVPPADVPPSRTLLAGPSRSSAVAISGDDHLAVVANRTAHSVSVFALTAGPPATATRTAEVSTGEGSEPWAVAISPDGNTAYVALRREAQLARVDNLRGTPTLASSRTRVGAEPTGVALSPNGRRIFVASWGEGTVSVLDAASFAVTDTLDLNATLVRGGYLGAGAASRHGLAHPRALVVTNDGDEDESDETLYVTEFFSQRRSGPGPAGVERFDQDRVGVVYRYPLGSRMLDATAVSAAADLGFRSADGSVAGCFPNQLSALAVAFGRVYVTALCESPRGPVGPAAPAPADGGVTADAAVPDGGPLVPPLDPALLNFRTQHTGAIFVLDANTGIELPAQRVLLNARFFALYEDRRTPDDASRRYPLLPVDIAFQPLLGGSTAGSTVAWVVGEGSDALFRVRFSAAGALAEVGNPATGMPVLPPFVDLGSPVNATGTALSPARLPYGIAMTSAGATAVTVQEHTRNVAVVTFSGGGPGTSQKVSAVVESSAAPMGAAAQAADGRRLFVTGLGRWSLKGQAWNSCESCHPDGLTDNVTWFFGRGPRQTIPLDATLDAMGAPRIMNWTAVFDELADFELNARGNSGGVGAVVHRANDGAMPPRVSNEDRIVFDGTTAVGMQRPTADRQDGLSGSIDSIATPAGMGTPRGALDDWALIGQYVRAIRTPRGPEVGSAADVAEGRVIFTQAGCDGCHGGAHWSAARRFYTPGAANNDRTTGALITRRWTRPAGSPSGLFAEGGTYRLSPFDAANDQLSCALRNVGTWAMGAGVAPAGVDLLEVRANMTAASQGATGFNPPPLAGVAHGAPYFHAGNARTLEEALGTTFATHRDVYAPTGMFEGAGGVVRLRQVIAFLLSIDDRTMEVPVPSRIGGAFDPDVCGQFR